jgi:AcrR family transcriptional regulator
LPATAGAKTKVSPRMEEILSCAAELFYAKGYHATTIEDVAREVGMLKGSLYYYIRSKEDLLYQLLMDVIVKGEQKAAAALEGVTGAAERLEKAIGAHIEYIIQNQTHVGLFLHEFDSLSGKRQKRIQEEMSRYQEHFVAIVRQGQQEGSFVQADAWLLVNGMLGIGNWIYRWYGRAHKEDPGEVKRIFVSMILNGIRRQ